LAGIGRFPTQVHYPKYWVTGGPVDHVKGAIVLTEAKCRIVGHCEQLGQQRANDSGVGENGN